MSASLGLVDAFEKAAQIRRNRSRGLRDLSLFSPVAAAGTGRLLATSSVVGNRDAAAGGLTPSVRVTRDTRAEGSMSSTVGEDPLTPRTAAAGLDAPLQGYEVPGVSGSVEPVTLMVHQREDGPRQGPRCTGTDCPGCEAGRRHYRETGCTVAGCPGRHGRVLPPRVGQGDES